MKRSEAFPSQYLSKDDVHAPRIVTIADVQAQSIKGDNGDEQKPVMYFSDFPKPFIINNVNWMTVESEYGDDSDLWRGKQIELYVDPNIMFGNKRVGGVRIRIPQFQTNRAAPARNTNGNGEMTFDQAVAECVKHGITKPELTQYLKMKGLTGYRADRDTPTVRQFIEEMGAKREFDELPGETPLAQVSDEILL